MSAVLHTGQRIAGYTVDELLASGGMGVVYRATQLSLGRTVALKVLAPNLSADPEFAERFRREAALQARLEHPNIVTVYEAGESDEGLFLAMKFVAGTDLKRLVAAGLSTDRALQVLLQIASALDAAHEAGLVHRDVKPQNVLVDAGDRAYLADFGLTKSTGGRGITRSGTYLGSLDYVSPEQIRGEPVTDASDRYALAAVLYECVAGEIPFPHQTEAALLYAHVSEPPPRVSTRRPELGSAIDAVVARGLAKEPSDRYGTCSELMAAAQRALAGADARDFGRTVVDAGTLRRAPVIDVEVPRRRPARSIIAALIALGAGLAAAGFLLGHSHTSDEHAAQSLAVAGPLTLRFPSSDWQPSSPPPSLVDAVALDGTNRADRGKLVVGIARSVDARTLLPRGLTGKSAEQVRLGEYDALRYRGTRADDIYAIPIGLGAALVECRGNAAARQRCESVATTLSIRGVRTGSVGPDARYAAQLAAAVRRLQSARVAERRALAAAHRAGERAGHADLLSSAYATAEAQVSAIRPAAHEQSAHTSLLRALGRARDGYVSLSAALRAGDHSAYVSAARRIAAAERAVNGALRSLARLGYRISH